MAAKFRCAERRVVLYAGLVIVAFSAGVTVTLFSLRGVVMVEPPELAPTMPIVGQRPAIAASVMQHSLSPSPLLASPSAAPSLEPSPPPPPPWTTSQVCHHLADDSEYCVYTGPFCWSGDDQHQLVALSDTPDYFREERDDARNGGCGDARDYEPLEYCGYITHGVARRLPPDPRVGPAEVSSLPAERVGRLWGPHERQILIGHVPPAWVANVTTDEQALALGGVGFAAARRALAATANSSAIRGPLLPPERVTWIPASEGAMYYARVDPHGFVHPWHFSIATFQLWAVMRANSSTRGEEGSPYRFRVGGSIRGGELPPMARLALVTESPTWSNDITGGLEGLHRWARGAIRLMLPPGNRTRVVLPGEARRELNVSRAHWLCSMGGVVVGEKTRLFTGAGDAHAWRRAAYAAAGLPPEAAWPAYPPRTITVMRRRGGYRNFLNHDAVLDVLNATGLQVIETYSDGSWEEQVAVYANTGILIAPHGAGLTNVIYMPARSAVIEVVPHRGAFPVFRRIAETSRVVYHRVHSRLPSAAAIAAGLRGPDPRGGGLQAGGAYYMADYKAECANLTFMDAPTSVLCRGPVKYADVEVPLDELVRTLEYALDDIGCIGGRCWHESGTFTDLNDRIARNAPAAERRLREQSELLQRETAADSASLIFNLSHLLPAAAGK